VQNIFQIKKICTVLYQSIQLQLQLQSIILILHQILLHLHFIFFPWGSLDFTRIITYSILYTVCLIIKIIQLHIDLHNKTKKWNRYHMCFSQSAILSDQCASHQFHKSVSLTFIVKLQVIAWDITKQSFVMPTLNRTTFNSHLWSVPVRGRLTPKSQQACKSP
jgi:hypothetical protein